MKTFAVTLARLVREEKTIYVQAESAEQVQAALSEIYDKDDGADFQPDNQWGCEEGTHDFDSDPETENQEITFYIVPNENCPEYPDVLDPKDYRKFKEGSLCNCSGCDCGNGCLPDCNDQESRCLGDHNEEDPDDYNDCESSSELEVIMDKTDLKLAQRPSPDDL